MHVRLLTALLLTIAFLPQHARPRSAASLAELRPRLQEIADTSKGRVGAAVALLETGDEIALNAEGRFPMQSVYKLPIAMAVLRLADAGSLKLDDKVRVNEDDIVPPQMHSPLREKHPKGGFEMSVRELLRLMMVESDGTACDVLLRVAGGAERVGEYLRGLGSKR